MAIVRAADGTFPIHVTDEQREQLLFLVNRFMGDERMRLYHDRLTPAQEAKILFGISKLEELKRELEQAGS